MDKSTKILCVCNKGNVRSVGTRYELYHRGYTNVLAVGATNTSKETLKMLCDWAEVILLAKPYHIEHLPDGHEKVNNSFTIGEDIYQNPLHKDLQALVHQQLDLIGFN